MGNRRQARECALQMLYQLDMSRGEADEIVARFWQTNEADSEVRAFADELVRGVVKNMGELDDLLSSHSTNWKISRMAAVDKNVLRLAAYELTNRPDIPVKVTINEAVEIAKRFGTAESGAFVNGILDNIAGKVKKDKPGEEK